MTEAEKAGIRAIAKEAAMRLKGVGWIQGSYMREGQGYCLLGAINAATGYDEGRFRQLLIDRIERKVHEVITRWNDRKERTSSEVLKVLRESVPR